MATYADIAFHLAEAREDAGKTQQDAAKFLGKTYQAISNWERGQSKIDSVSLLRLLLFYKVDVYKFIEDCGFEVMDKVDRSDYYLSKDAREVAHEYTLLATIAEKNMVRNGLKLKPLLDDNDDSSENLAEQAKSEETG